jgi:hypothetical protein
MIAPEIVEFYEAKFPDRNRDNALHFYVYVLIYLNTELCEGCGFGGGKCGRA